MEYFDIKTILGEKINNILSQDENTLNKDDKYLKEAYANICNDMENRIPKELGEMLIRENNDPNYTILIHRSSRAKKENFFQKGLIIAGGNDLSYTTSRFKNNLSLLIGVANSPGYKNSSRCIIMKIPNTALNYEKGKTKPILLKTNSVAEQSSGLATLSNNTYQTILLPEYILGSVEFNKDNEISCFSPNPNYTDVHNYKNNELVCPNETISSYIRQTNSDDLDNDTINEIICKQNTDYMLGKNFSKTSSFRSEADIKKYSKKEMLFSKLNKLSQKIKSFFTKDKYKGER